jgi:hypothetical protein
LPWLSNIGTDYGRREYPKPDRRHHRADRQRWADRQTIPIRPPIDRRLVEEMREQARRDIADVKPTIEAALRAV